jgi:Dienelactone hydrolase and related enzymes
MKQSRKFFVFLIIISITFAMSSKANSNSMIPGLIEQEVNYTANGVTMKGFVAYSPVFEGKRPAILVVPEWWGNNDYSRMRVRMLAQLGYIAMAVDMYGDGKIATTPQEAQQLAGALYKDPQLANVRIEAAVKELLSFPEADPTKLAAIGYCFGGSMVLNAAKEGMDFKGVVSFHGGLSGGVMAKKGEVKAKILVCHGGADKFVTQADIDSFKKNLDEADATYTFKVYPGATHAFTNPASTEVGKKFNMPIKYNKVADEQSWQDMMDFFKTIF